MARVAGKSALSTVRSGFSADAASEGLGDVSENFPNGCQIAEVKIDPNTGGVVIEGYTVVDDFGRTVNSLLLESQVPGGIVQGIGQALFEHAVYDPDTDRLVHGLRHAARWRCSALRFLNS
jgi:CO/xanthine dehydrogenase Mo-binding subunit